jgi:hypothetical protein
MTIREKITEVLGVGSMLWVLVHGGKKKVVDF